VRGRRTGQRRRWRRDYLIVVPSLIDAIGRWRISSPQRAEVAVVDVNQVYDQFNDGISHPVAIKNLIDYAREHWAVKPRYVLLVGTASFDIASPARRSACRPISIRAPAFLQQAHRHARGPSGRNLIRPGNTLRRRAVASDNRFVATSDKDYHPASDRLGRHREARGALLLRVGPPAWRPGSRFRSLEFPISATPDEIAQDIGAQGFTSEKIYGNQAERDNLAHQAAINDGLNNGELLVHFIGHGGRFIWRTGRPDPSKNHDLFTLADVSNLRNGMRLPMVLSMTCFSAPFDNPGEDSIGERFLLEPDKGAVAVFAASWTNAPSAAFSRTLVSELIKPGQTIGDAIVAAKQESNDPMMVEMYNLLGDPALVLERPRERVDIVRSGDRWQDAITVRVPEPGFGGEVSVDWVDAAATLSTRDL
jgi:hypothetical protein